MIARRPGGLQTFNYSMPPTYSVGKIQYPNASPARWKAPSVGVRPDYSGNKNLMEFPNLTKAAKGLMGSQRGIQASLTQADIDRMASGRRGGYQPLPEEPADTMDDPGFPGPPQMAQPSLFDAPEDYAFDQPTPTTNWGTQGPMATSSMTPKQMKNARTGYRGNSLYPDSASAGPSPRTSAGQPLLSPRRRRR